MREPPEFPGSAVLVVAHPDDEALWFSGVLEAVERIIVCFGPYGRMPGLGRARGRAAARHPLACIQWLGLDEPMSGLAADWTRPVPDEYGLRLTFWSAARARYRRAFAEVKRALQREVRPGMQLITHNPWGEYGHEDHVLVHRAVVAVARERGVRVWCTNYCSERARRLADRSRHLRAPHVRRTDQRLAQSIRDVYVDELCWTWDPAYQWPETETYLEAVEADAAPGSGDWQFNMLAQTRLPARVGAASHVWAHIRHHPVVQALWWKAVGWAASRGVRVRLPGADRQVLEECILPYLGDAEHVRDVLFVGVDWYTAWYGRILAGKRWVTMDVDPRKARFGSSGDHIVDTLAHLSRHVRAGSLDVIVCNKVLGWGLNHPDEIERAFAQCWEALRPGGLLVLGWNDVAPHRPVRPERIASLARFAKSAFPPLSAERYVAEGLLRHTYDFHTRGASD